ncbi:ABC transporter ATP-binding protein [Dyella sp.]|uniref:ABC transporter ATP-binding protein n=1 Tax=Dyella sp. TaxID=1869338 RepID=UPI002ED1E4CF
MNLATVPTIDATTPLLDIRHATVLRGDRSLLDLAALSIAQGEHTAILGPNGSGKSTLVKLITRQLYPLARDDGSSHVHIYGRERWQVSELRKLLGIVSPALQLDYTSDSPLEVFDAVISGFFAARGLGLDHQVTMLMRERATEALRLMHADHLIGREMATLSTGEARRVLIARALTHRPRALLLDEPCMGLDPAARRQFLETLRGLARHGTTLILVTHHIEEILPDIQRVVMLRQGGMFADGSKQALLTGERLGSLFGVPVEVTQHEGYFSARF